MGSKWAVICISMIFLWMNEGVIFHSCKEHFINNTRSQTDCYEKAIHIGNGVSSEVVDEEYTIMGNMEVDNSNDKLISEYELQEIICDTIESLLVCNQTDISILPGGTKLNKVIVIDHSLLLDFSKNILNYGGTERERLLVKSILEIAFGFDEINDVTIAIDGEVENLVEGTLINGYTREKWEKEREDHDQ